MKYPSLLNGSSYAVILMALFINGSFAAESPDSLKEGFDHPSAAAKPRTWWHWVSGNVTKEGITADLEAMKGIGLAGAQIFTVDQSNVKGSVRFMSAEWREFMHFAMEEAGRLNLELAVEGCDGWSESGGPWVTPAESMQKVVWSQRDVRGGTKISLDLPQPETIRNHYGDIGLFAFPTPEKTMIPPPVKISSSDPSFDGEKLIRDTERPVVFRAGKDPDWIEFEYEKPVSPQSVLLNTTLDPWERKILFTEFQAADEKGNFRKVCNLANGLSENFPPVTSKRFRFWRGTLSAKDTNDGILKNGSSIPILELSVGDACIPGFEAKAGMQSKSPFLKTFEQMSLKPSQLINPKGIIDLTGQKEWNAPAGNWTILRVGHTSTGAITHPSTTPGLECNKLSPEAVQNHLGSMFGPLIADSAKAVGGTFKEILLDSWECGCENWTADLPAEFKKRRGYDLTPWLPALTRRIVGSSEQTQQFLWDYRRTLADLLAEVHYGGTQKFAHDHGMRLTSEATGIGMPTVADQLLCKKYCDIPMGEFWVNRSRDGNIDDPKETASAAHLYGQNIASAESFTSTPNTAAWKNDPYSLKALGDQEFCLGVNRFVFHRYAHQPWLDRKPGMSMGPWGINFERTNTWWKPGAAWISYLSRCQELLQRGRFVADLCYFYGEGAPACVHHEELTPAVPKGYDYDVCNADMILKLMEVKDGRITTPSGMSYRVLVLPNEDRMTLPVLQKVAKLVHEGAVVFGPKPLRTPSLSGYPAADQELSKLADEVWGNCDGKNVTEHAYGAGKIVWGIPLEKALNVPPDFSTPEGDFLFIHRKTDNTEIYFVSNQEQKSLKAECSFRVTGKIPELWHPDTGKREPVVLYTTDKVTTTIPMIFDPIGSVFVIFQKPETPAPHPVSLASATDGKKADPSPARLEILKATFGAGDKTVDVTTEVASMVTNGMLSFQVNTKTLGVSDPAPGVVKQLLLEYKLNGQPSAKTIAENSKADLETKPSFLPEASLQGDFQKKTMLNARQNGSYTVTMSDGSTKSLSVTNLPAPLTLKGAWDLTFPPFTEGKGEPVKTTFEKLISWSDTTEDAIKYFSGTATYTKNFTLPEGYLAKNRRFILDLGNVKNIAEVTLNDKSLGILWKEPFQVDVTDSLKAGKNGLSIKVTNLWPNRLIGDQKLPEKDRSTWVSVSLYKGTDPLLPSGLIGPVTIRPEVVMTIAEPK
jgi:hypothetical protein